MVILQAWCDKMSLDTVMHPVTKCVIFLEDLLANMVAKKSKDPFGTIRVARKALSKIRELQRGVPPPYGEAFSKETLIRSASSKAFAATTEARIGPDSDPLRDGFQATSLDQDEVERILDACIKHSDHWSGFKQVVVPLTGKVNSSGWLRYSGFVRHKEPHLDAVGALADLLVFTLNLTGLDILQKIESQDTTWWSYRLLFKDLYHADRKQDRTALAKPLQSILQEVEGSPVVKTKVLHLFRDSGVMLASGGAGSELLSIWGHWAQGTLQQAYLEKNRLSALVAFAIAGGWDQTSFMRRHFYGRALVSVPEQWIDSLYPGARRLLEDVKMRNARLQSGKRQADDKISDRAAEGFLQTVLYSGICFGRICHSGHREYLEFAQQVMVSHDKADKQAELDVWASMGEMLQDMQACLMQLCGSSAVGDPEAVARMIAEKISAKNISLDAGHASEDLGEILALPPPAAKQDVILPDMPADAKRLKANLIHCMIPAAASTLYRWPGKSGTLAQHRPP
ncbi:TPA: hypothetical protein ACH3X1_007208 [Trebouxia sp. C0004]